MKKNKVKYGTQVLLMVFAVCMIVIWAMANGFSIIPSFSEAGIKNSPSGEQKPTSVCSSSMIFRCNGIVSDFGRSARICDDAFPVPPRGNRASRKECKDALRRDYDKKLEAASCQYCNIGLPTSGF